MNEDCKKPIVVVITENGCIQEMVSSKDIIFVELETEIDEFNEPEVIDGEKYSFYDWRNVNAYDNKEFFDQIIAIRTKRRMLK